MMKIIDISTPKYPNTFAMVDDEDFEYLNQWKWSPNDKGYVWSGDSANKKIRLHREIVKAPKDMIVDHINRNKLDNRKENLRICTTAENSRNRTPYLNRKLPKGVSWIAHERRYYARICANYKNIFLGTFRTEFEAAEAYNVAAVKYFGEFARINEKGDQP